ncbi:unnamed protein product [Malus baccata var. baccata]
MQRSTSASRVSSEEDLLLTYSSSPESSTFKPTTDEGSDGDQHEHLHLPTYDPLSHVAKRERRRIRSAENAIHLIPVLLVLCAFILWFFSNPGTIYTTFPSFPSNIELEFNLKKRFMDGDWGPPFYSRSSFKFI